MTMIHCVDMYFEAQQIIKSLPPFHGARWSAWLRYACARATLHMEDMVHSLLPLRNGISPVMPGDRLTLRLIVPTTSLPVLPEVVRAMLELPPQGEFSSRTLYFAGFGDGLHGTPLPVSALREQKVRPVTREGLADRITALQTCEGWRLRLVTPLRLTLPAGEKTKAGGVGRFCGVDFFRQDRALGHLLEHVRLLSPAVCGAGIRLRDMRLRWADMRYSRQRGVALGGVTGELCAVGRPDEETALRLVLGEYLGAGKNGRFGLGFWQVAATDNASFLTAPAP